MRRPDRPGRVRGEGRARLGYSSECQGSHLALPDTGFDGPPRQIRGGP